MRKIVILALFAVCAALPVEAQDLIVKKDASKIEAKVTEITSSEIRYKKANSSDGPTYVLPVADVDYIQYKNGDRDLFSEKTGQITTGERYSVGDIYYIDGVPQGMVYKVSDGGRHGMVMSLDEECLEWSTMKHSAGAVDQSDGKKNMEYIGEYIARHSLSWDNFPAFKWCRDKGEGWYLPAVDQLLDIGNSFNGGKRLEIDRAARKIFNGVLKSNGGANLNRRMYYFSSMEQDDRFVVCAQMSIEPPYVFRRIPKTMKFLVRAVREF